jgi:hypothetical protein
MRTGATSILYIYIAYTPREQRAPAQQRIRQQQHASRHSHTHDKHTQTITDRARTLARTHTHARARAHTHTHTHKHTHTHTYICTRQDTHARHKHQKCGTRSQSPSALSPRQPLRCPPSQISQGRAAASQGNCSGQGTAACASPFREQPQRRRRRLRQTQPTTTHVPPALNPLAHATHARTRAPATTPAWSW